MKQKIIVLASVSLLLGILFDILFVGKELGISFPLFTIVVLGASYGLARLFKHKLSPSVLLLAPVPLVFSFFVYYRADAFLGFLNVMFVWYACMLLFRLLYRPEKELWQLSFSGYLADIVKFPLQSVLSYFNFVGKAGRILSSPESEEERMNGRRSARRQELVPIVRGVAISLPILVIFLALLVSADQVFGQFIGSIFSLQLSGELFWRTVLILLVASCFIGTFTLIYTSARPAVTTPLSPRQRLLGSVDSSIILGSVGFLFLVFVLFQITYLFGGESRVLGTGFTYATYARKGFFELIAVAAISLVLILVVNAITARKTLQQKRLFKGLAGMLIVEVMVIMLSAHQRLSLYEQTYGYTGLRLYSHIFIVFLAVVFIMLLLHIGRELASHQLALQLFLTVIVFLFLINVLNPDAFIARQNAARYASTGKIDEYYITSLSDDAVPELVKLLDVKDVQVRRGIGSGLYHHLYALETGDVGWQGTNNSRRQALKILQKHATELKQLHEDSRDPEVLFPQNETSGKPEISQ